MKKEIYFKYKNHPGDLLRNTDTILLPDPEKNLEEFLIWFLKNYQSDDTVTYLDDLHKLLDDEFFDEEEKIKFQNHCKLYSKEEIISKINSIENELKNEAFKNFYDLVLNNKIEIIIDGKE